MSFMNMDKMLIKKPKARFKVLDEFLEDLGEVDTLAKKPYQTLTQQQASRVYHFYDQSLRDFEKAKELIRKKLNKFYRKMVGHEK